MTVMQRRNRMVNFRLSQQEYEELRKLCITHGARSLSDYARDVVYRSVTGSRWEDFEQAVLKLNGRIDQLDGEVKALAHCVRALAPRRKGRVMECS